MKYSFTSKDQFKIILISILITLFVFPFALNHVDILVSKSQKYLHDFSSTLQFYSVIVILPSVVILFHESLHALFYILFGGKIKMSFKKGFAYTQEISGISIPTHKYIIVLLSPAVIISLTSLFFSSAGIILMFLNLLGSSSDLYTAYLVSKFTDKCVIDRPYGFEIVSSVEEDSSLNI